MTGQYWGKAGEVAGLIKGVQVRGRDDIELELNIQGTSTEAILQWASGATEKMIRVHLCGAQMCQGTPTPAGS